MATLLALDIASTTGFAFGLVGEGRRPIKSGVVRFQGSSTVKVCADALVWANKLLAEFQPDEVVIEAPFLSSSAGGFSSASTMQRLIGLQANISTVVYLKFRDEPQNMAVSTVRKNFLGTGKVPRQTGKLLVHSRCCELGWADDETEFDETDALSLWAAHACQISLPFRQSFDARMPENAEIIMRDVEFKLKAEADRRARRKEAK